MKFKIAATVAAIGLLAACEPVPMQNFDGNAVRGALAPEPLTTQVETPAPRQITRELVESDLPPPPMEMGLGGGEPLSSLTPTDSDVGVDVFVATPLGQ